MSLVVISTNECAKIFELIGAKCSVVKNQREAETAFMEALTVHPSIIMVDEEVSEMISEFKERLFKDLREPPVIVIMPSFAKSRGSRLSQLYDLIGRAVGVKLRWQS